MKNLSTVSSGVTIYKNAWYHPLGEGDIEFAFEGQYYNSLSEFQTGTGFGDTSGWTDPLFVSKGSVPDLHISSNSPVIDWDPMPFTNFGEFDIDGQAREDSTSIDLGADEIDSSVGIFELPLNHIEINPNPVWHAFTIISDSSEINEVSIIDLQGKTVYNSSNKNITGKLINIDHLDTGLYLLQSLDFNGNKFQTKLVKK